MLKLKKYQQYILATLSSFILFLLGFVILAFSFLRANRQQAASIKQVTDTVIDAYTETEK